MKYAKIVAGVVDALALDQPLVLVEKTRQVTRARLVEQEAALDEEAGPETPRELAEEGKEETETYSEYEPEPGWIEVGDDVFAGFLFDGETFTPPPAEPPPPLTVPKSTVMQRVTDAGKMAAAFALLMKNPENFAKWFAPDKPVVRCDDPEAGAVVLALGLNPAEILAPYDALK